MLIVGAGGFARHCLQALYNNSYDISTVRFFDNVTPNLPNLVYGKYCIVTSLEEAKTFFETNSPEFILGVGGPCIRKKLSDQMQMQGGILTSLISNYSIITDINGHLGSGLCVMENAIINNDTFVGEGCLINSQALISHDAHIGCYCDIAPGAKLLGRSTVGDYCQIGSNAVILPDIKIGNNVIVGAGAVVIGDVPDGYTVVGVPAKPIKQQSTK